MSADQLPKFLGEAPRAFDAFGGGGATGAATGANTGVGGGACVTVVTCDGAVAAVSCQALSHPPW